MCWNAADCQWLISCARTCQDQQLRDRYEIDPLTSRSSYLRRRLTSRLELTLAPPLKIKADTFGLVADFCYGAHIVVTPFNVAALRTAAELLEMTDGNGDGGDDLRLVTETSFRRFAAVNKEYIVILFRSCLDLLPEAETMASLVSRCIEAYGEMEKVESRADGGGDGSVTFFDGIVAVGIKEFEVMTDSMGGQLSNHDVLYQMVNVYFKEHGGKMTEDRKAQICQSVDCTKLSPDLLVHAVQNPKMPLRFIIRAMLVEQLRTRHSFLHAAPAAAPNSSSSDPGDRRRKPPTKAVSAAEAPPAATTLGAILNRDAALRQSAQLRAAMAATRSRILNLEEELSTMKLRLMNEMTALDTTNRENVPTGLKSLLNSGRSQSFGHYGAPQESNKIERGEGGSVSSLSLRFIRGGDEGGEVAAKDPGSGMGSPRSRKSIRQRLINGLKSAFGSSNDLASKGGSKGGNLPTGARNVHARHGNAFSPQVGS
ncbi:hypothetical protein CDL15_Pgr001675 [Punica granatum]|uniref:NPH3 domain-containing protein n=1 Tax=Punica granatum TaxID=22663 RepID=A0A218XC58_PUNGR|nr:hypothetical protein CDL15_Pgr001675 [Punica granatum]